MTSLCSRLFVEILNEKMELYDFSDGMFITVIAANLANTITGHRAKQHKRTYESK
jgi:hypothetical protein